MFKKTHAMVLFIPDKSAEMIVVLDRHPTNELTQAAVVYTRTAELESNLVALIAGSPMKFGEWRSDTRLLARRSILTSMESDNCRSYELVDDPHVFHDVVRILDADTGANVRRKSDEDYVPQSCEEIRQQFVEFFKGDLKPNQ